ncbi:MAG: GAF domain-containing protein [Rhizobiaceae bacterium]|nr:GAF domain-containing protein [Rhizobiaceae bacterium]
MEHTDFKSSYKSVAGRQAEHHSATVALQHVVLPIAIALLGVSTPFLWETHQFIPVALWIFLVAIYGLVWWKSNPAYDDVHRLLLQKQQDDERIAQLEGASYESEEIIDDLYYKNIAAFAYRAMSLEYIRSIRTRGLNAGYFSEIMDELLSPFYLQGDSIFGFVPSEKWSIGIYLYSKPKKLLKPVWRQKSNNHPSQGMGREWRSGEGHVGKAFLDRRPILTGNANDDAVAQLCRARSSKQLDYDSKTYISFASVPIGLADDDNVDPFGVLVATSDREDRLSEESTTELLMHAAETIAVILELSGADIGCLTDPNHATENNVKGVTDGRSKAKARRSGGENG